MKTAPGQARIIIRRLLRKADEELRRQVREGQLTYVGPIDINSRLTVEGILDLAALYNAMEEALRTEFVA